MTIIPQFSGFHAVFDSSHKMGRLEHTYHSNKMLTYIWKPSIESKQGYLHKDYCLEENPLSWRSKKIKITFKNTGKW